MNAPAPKNTNVRVLRAIMSATDPTKGLPYLSPAISLLRPMAAPGQVATGTLSVSNTGRLLYEPAFIDACSDSELVWVVLHETMHLVLDHYTRANAAGVPMTPEERRRWNIAGDLEINSSLQQIAHLKDKYPKASKPCLPEKYGFKPNLPVESYYKLLREKNEPPQQPQDGSGQVEGPGEGGCGSAAGGDPRDDDDQPEESNEITQAVATQLEAARRQIGNELRKPEYQGRGIGNVPGALRSWLEARGRPPKVRWPRVLQRLITTSVDRRAGCEDFDWMKPSRRQGALGWEDGTPILPRGIKGIPTIEFHVDTSGSMSDRQLNQIVREVLGCCKYSEAGVTVVTFDTRIHQVWEGLHNVQPIVRQGFRGRGGTDFRPSFERAAITRPDLLVISTDGWGPAPTVKGFPGELLWLLVNSTSKPTTFGRSLEITAE